MVHIYYHIYAIDGVEELIKEQLGLIEKYFLFEYKLNIGLSISVTNGVEYDISNVLKLLPVEPRITEIMGQEFMTLYMMRDDAKNLDDTDLIFHLHTKGVTSIKKLPNLKDNIVSWRNVMHYFNIERVDYVFYILNNTIHNTYGCLYVQFLMFNIPHKFYAGNFFWGKASYIKTLTMENINENDRMDAEMRVIHSGKNWKPFSPYNKNVHSHYDLYFDPNEYRKLHLKYSWI